MPNAADNQTSTLHSSTLNYFYRIPAKTKLLDETKAEESTFLTRVKPKTTLSLPFSLPKTRHTIQYQSERRIDPNTTRVSSLGITARTARSNSLKGNTMQRRDHVQEEFEL